MGLVLNGNYVSSANAQVRLTAAGGGSNLFTSIQSLKMDDEVNPVLVMAIGSYAPVGSTDGDYKATGELGMPLQEMQFFHESLAALHPLGSISLVKFDVTVVISNNIDPSITVVMRKCRIMKRGVELAKGSAEPLIDTSPLLVEWIERNGKRLIAPNKAFVGVR